MSGRRLAVYFASGTEERIDLNGLLDGEVYGGWFNPSDGRTELLSGPLTITNGILSIKNNSADGLDRVLILASTPEGCRIPSRTYGEERTTGEVKKVFEW